MRELAAGCKGAKSSLVLPPHKQTEARRELRNGCHSPMPRQFAPPPFLHVCQALLSE